MPRKALRVPRAIMLKRMFRDGQGDQPGPTSRPQRGSGAKGPDQGSINTWCEFGDVARNSNRIVLPLRILSWSIETMLLTS